MCYFLFVSLSRANFSSRFAYRQKNNIFLMKTWKCIESNDDGNVIVVLFDMNARLGAYILEEDFGIDYDWAKILIYHSAVRNKFHTCPELNTNQSTKVIEESLTFFCLYAILYDYKHFIVIRLWCEKKEVTNLENRIGSIKLIFEQDSPIFVIQYWYKVETLTKL